MGKSDKNEIKTHSPNERLPRSEIRRRDLVLVEDPIQKEMNNYDRARGQKSMSAKDGDGHSTEVMDGARNGGQGGDYFEETENNDFPSHSLNHSDSGAILETGSIINRETFFSAYLPLIGTTFPRCNAMLRVMWQ